uniref:Uncharacterized protein n=1 Tax=Leptocylindrus danicus TaxID=163516 RepID=A0A7S2P8W0_9STRA
MNSHQLRSICTIARGRKSSLPNRRSFHVSNRHLQAMPAGTDLRGFDFLKKHSEGERLLAKPREEYPEWVSELAPGLKTLAELRKMEFEDATDKERMRYLVLSRRRLIKENNLDANN